MAVAYLCALLASPVLIERWLLLSDRETESASKTKKQVGEQTKWDSYLR